MSEWTGNPLTKEGCKLSLTHVSGELRKLHMRGRHWVLDVLDPLRMESCLLSVVLRNMMPEEAMRDAEMLLGWADAYYGSPETP